MTDRRQGSINDWLFHINSFFYSIYRIFIVVIDFHVNKIVIDIYFILSCSLSSFSRICKQLIRVRFVYEFLFVHQIRIDIGCDNSDKKKL